MTAVNESVLKVTFSEKKKKKEKRKKPLENACQHFFLGDESGPARLPQSVMDIFWKVEKKKGPTIRAKGLAKSYSSHSQNDLYSFYTTKTIWKK